jgi:PKD repeat protein
VARTIIEAVRTVVYDSLDNWLRVKPSADFSATINGYSVQFENQSELAHSYKWIFENGDTSLAENAVYTFSEVGNHTVTLIAERHCTYDTIQKVITIDSNASIAGVYDIDNLKVYPNPTKDIVFIDNASKRIHSVALIDATGRILISQDVNDNSTSLNLQNMQRGLYILAVYTHKDAPIYRKIIVE